MATPEKSPRPIGRWLIRAAGSAVILAVIFWLLPLADVIDAFARVSPGLFVAVLVLFAAGHWVAAAKWWVLLGRGLPFLGAVRAHFAGLAGNLCLPGAAGGDAVRAAVAQVTMRDGARVITGSVADRLIDMVALACLGVAGAAVLAGAEGGSIALAVQAALAVAAAALAGLFLAPRLVPAIWRAIPALPLRDLALRTAEALAGLARRPLVLAGAFGTSVAVQTLFVLLNIALARAIGIDVPAAAWFFAWPLAKILAVLPISLNGLGVREATLAGLMAPLGAVSADVVAAGLVWQAVLFAAGGTGAVVLALSGLGFRVTGKINE